jgi:[ribosomal protein S5]-alanine N-acetyltransferase
VSDVTGDIPSADRPTVRLVRLDVATMQLLLDGRLEDASDRAGVRLTPYLLDHGWLWAIRVEQVRQEPAAADWVARAAVVGAEVVGHVGFHGPPDEAGMVEVAYSVDPAHRRKGYAKAMLATALEWAAEDDRVRTVRASVSPDNIASLATLRPFGFVHVGEQWDDEDGRELLYERPARQPLPRARPSQM